MNKTAKVMWWKRGSTLAVALLMAVTLATGTTRLAHAAPATFTVTNTNDSGPGSLRQAINDTNDNNNSSDVDTIDFDIPAATDPGCDATSGVCTISPTSTLPDITEPVIVDGYTQPSASPNTQATGSNAALKVELNGERTNDGGSRNGITISTRNSVVKVLIINRYFASGISISDAGGNRIEGNFIGTDASGKAGLNNLFGIFVGAPDNVVGGTSAEARNVISGNNTGIQVDGNKASGNRVEGNLIGTDASGQGDLGNSRDGLVLLSALNNVVGGTTAGAGTLWFVSGIAGVLFPRLNEPDTVPFLIGGVVAAVNLVLLLVGFLGVAWGGALGGRLGKIFFAVAMLGYALMVVGAVQTLAGVGPLIDPEAGLALIYLVERLIAAVFTLLTGIAVLTARRWRGWSMFTPLLLGLCLLIGELGSLVVFGQPNQVLNAS